jgi:hypothetical protein
VVCHHCPAESHRTRSRSRPSRPASRIVACLPPKRGPGTRRMEQGTAIIVSNGNVEKLHAVAGTVNSQWCLRDEDGGVTALAAEEGGGHVRSWQRGRRQSPARPHSKANGSRARDPTIACRVWKPQRIWPKVRDEQLDVFSASDQIQPLDRSSFTAKQQRSGMRRRWPRHPR